MKEMPPRVFPFRVARPLARRLVCLPYAGGSALAYRSWSAALPSVDVCAYELPGRGGRIGEKLTCDARALVGEIASALQPLLPVAIFGHSLGGSLAVEVSRAVGDGVTHTFVSATSPREHTPARRW